MLDAQVGVGNGSEPVPLGASLAMNLGQHDALWQVNAVREGGYPLAFGTNRPTLDDNGMEAFMAFVQSNPAMHQALRANDWTTFARLYNGPGAVVSYSGRITDAYRRHVGGGIADLGPPLPYADPARPARSPISSRTVIAGGVAGVSTLGAIADQASMVSQLAGSAASAGYSMSALLRTFGPAILLGVVALGAVGFIVWRYITKMRTGDVVGR